MRIVFFGSGAFAVPTLQALGQTHHSIVAVVTAPDRPAGRGRRLTPTPVAQWSAANDLPVFKLAQVADADLLGRLPPLEPELFVAIAFGQKLPAPLLAIARYGGVNLHPSLLPQFRGAAPVPWAILSDRSETGVSVIRLADIMDGGDILGVQRTTIAGDETAGELHDRLARLGAPLVVQVVDQLAEGTAKAVPQDGLSASRAPKLHASMAWVDVHQPAAAVSSRIRGLSPWPGCRAEFVAPGGGRRVEVLLLKCREQGSLSAASEPPGSSPLAPTEPGTVRPDLTIACQTGAVELLQLQPLARRAMDLKAFVNGYGLKPGWRLHSGPGLASR